MKSFFILSFLFSSASLFAQYAPSAFEDGTTAMHKDASDFVAWATGCTVERGYQDISDISLGLATTGIADNGIGAPMSVGVVSLGDGGTAILTFDGLITNGPGTDFAVFENSFDDLFLELAVVEVSSDGVNYFRFDAVSMADTNEQVGTFDNSDATSFYNLAGKYRAGFGTPFDLDELDGIAGLNVDSIGYVKIIDVIGSINPLYATYDSEGNAINDPWPTPFDQGGFDLDAVGVIHFGLVGIKEEKLRQINVFPNPVNFNLNIQLSDNSGNQVVYEIYNTSGQKVKKGSSRLVNSRSKIEVNDLDGGIYFLKATTSKGTFQTTFVKKKIR